jgi:hypothetical protein
MRRQAIMGTYVLHEHMFPCQAFSVTAVRLLAMRKWPRLIEIAVGLTILAGLSIWGWLTHGIR